MIIILIVLHYFARLTTATLPTCVVCLLDIVPATYIPAMVADMVSAARRADPNASDDGGTIIMSSMFAGMML